MTLLFLFFALAYSQYVPNGGFEVDEDNDDRQHNQFTIILAAYLTESFLDPISGFCFTTTTNRSRLLAFVMRESARTR
jgi:hypothetical protein